MRQQYYHIWHIHEHISKHILVITQMERIMFPNTIYKYFKYILLYFVKIRIPSFLWCKRYSVDRFSTTKKQSAPKTVSVLECILVTYLWKLKTSLVCKIFVHRHQFFMALIIQWCTPLNHLTINLWRNNYYKCAPIPIKNILYRWMMTVWMGSSYRTLYIL